jgi:hypothetical protein
MTCSPARSLSVDDLHRLIADAAKRCLELERAIAAMTGLGADERAADEALRSTQQLLWLYQAHLDKVDARRCVPGSPRHTGAGSFSRS